MSQATLQRRVASRFSRARLRDAITRYAFVESQHPRGQPENRGEFAKSPSAVFGGGKAAEEPDDPQVTTPAISPGAHIPTVAGVGPTQPVKFGPPPEGIPPKMSFYDFAVRYMPDPAITTKMHAITSSVIPKLTPEDREGIGSYTSYGYGALNQQLISNREGGALSPEAAKLDQALERSIAAVGEWPEPVTVFRGISSSDEGRGTKFMRKIQQAIVEGTTFSEPQWGSTSLGVKFPLEYASRAGKNHIMLVIKSKTGIYTNGLSQNAAEEEVIKRKGTRYKPVRAYDIEVQVSQWSKAYTPISIIEAEEV